MAFKKVTRIIVPHGQTTRLAKHFGVSVQTVRNALTYTFESEQAAAIRKDAVMNYGGREVKVNTNHIRLK